RPEAPAPSPWPRTTPPPSPRTSAVPCARRSPRWRTRRWTGSPRGEPGGAPGSGGAVARRCRGHRVRRRAVAGRGPNLPVTGCGDQRGIGSRSCRFRWGGGGVVFVEVAEGVRDGPVVVARPVGGG